MRLKFRGVRIFKSVGTSLESGIGSRKGFVHETKVSTRQNGGTESETCKGLEHEGGNEGREQTKAKKKGVD